MPATEAATLIPRVDIQLFESGDVVPKTRTELQGRLDAFDAVMNQSVLDGAGEDHLWTVVELFCELPPQAFASPGDEVWWEERVFALVQRYGLTDEGPL